MKYLDDKNMWTRSPSGAYLYPYILGDSIKMFNSKYLLSDNALGTGTINMFKVNTNNEIDVGATMNIGTIELVEDSGVVTLVNLPVSSSASSGTEESYTFSIDSNPILKIRAKSDGTGGVTSLHQIHYGGHTRKTTTINAASYDLLESDDILFVSYTATGAVSINLKTAQCVNGRTIVIKDAGGNANTNNITITTEGTEKIDGSDTLVINTAYGYATLVSNGSHWFSI